MQPTLLNSCAYAATAAEARFRIDAKPPTARSSRVVGLDDGAAAVVRELAGQPWRNTRFLSLRGSLQDSLPGAQGSLRDSLRLTEELADADFVLMIATANDGAAVASAIGDACAQRGIMTAGVVLNGTAATDDAVAALRPHTRVLLVTSDRRDIAEIMSAVGA
jgi:hypothetical protein